MSLSIAWSFIMAAAIVVGLFIFIFATVRAGRRRKERGPVQDSTPHREVIGGRFDSAGGRQVMPRRDATPAQTPDSGQSEREG